MMPPMKIVQPGQGRNVKDEQGNLIPVPEGWEFLPAGDAGVTRRVTASGPFWRVQEKRGRKVFSRGVWAPGAVISEAKAAMEALRGSESYRKQLAAARNRREKKQELYVGEFFRAVKEYLRFAGGHAALEERMARAVTDHAVPVGSGTVARTERISLEERASRAVIAWMRHAVTDYDRRKIPRIKGKRREVRRELAKQCAALLDEYRTEGIRPPGEPSSPWKGFYTADRGFSLGGISDKRLAVNS